MMLKLLGQCCVGSKLKMTFARLCHCPDTKVSQTRQDPLTVPQRTDDTVGNRRSSCSPGSGVSGDLSRRFQIHRDRLLTNRRKASIGLHAQKQKSHRPGQRNVVCRRAQSNQLIFQAGLSTMNPERAQDVQTNGRGINSIAIWISDRDRAFRRVAAHPRPFHRPIPLA